MMRFCPGCAQPIDSASATSCQRCGFSFAGMPGWPGAPSSPYRVEAAGRPSGAMYVPYTAPPTRTLAPPKSPGVAGLLEFLIAGVGFMYVGKVWQGIVVLMASFEALILEYQRLVHLYEAAGCTVSGLRYYCFYSFYNTPDLSAAQNFVGIVVVGNIIWMIVRISFSVSLARKTRRAF